MVIYGYLFIGALLVLFIYSYSVLECYFLSGVIYLQLIKLVTSVSFEAPAGNDFIYMAEHGMMDVGIANLIEGMAPKLAPKNACNKFQVIFTFLLIDLPHNQNPISMWLL